MQWPPAKQCRKKAFETTYHKLKTQKHIWSFFFPFILKPCQEHAMQTLKSEGGSFYRGSTLLSHNGSYLNFDDTIGLWSPKYDKARKNSQFKLLGKSFLVSNIPLGEN